MALVVSGSSANSGIINSGFDPDKCLVERAVEFDKERRDANVYLHIKPLDGVPSVDPDKIENSHWGLLFEFSDYTVRYIEGNDRNGFLQGYFYKWLPTTQGKFFPLVNTVTSPRIILQAAVRNQCNNTRYYFSTNNCQRWVKQFTQEFGNTFLIKQLENYKTLEEARPFIAFVASASKRSWESSKDLSKSSLEAVKNAYGSFS